MEGSRETRGRSDRKRQSGCVFPRNPVTVRHLTMSPKKPKCSDPLETFIDGRTPRRRPAREIWGPHARRSPFYGRSKSVRHLTMSPPLFHRHRGHGWGNVASEAEAICVSTCVFDVSRSEIRRSENDWDGSPALSRCGEIRRKWFRVDGGRVAGPRTRRLFIYLFRSFTAVFGAAAATRLSLPRFRPGFRRVDRLVPPQATVGLSGPGGE